MAKGADKEHCTQENGASKEEKIIQSSLAYLGDISVVIKPNLLSQI